jgi:YebC/PmpR family DNA-binding regulatory protein
MAGHSHWSKIKRAKGANDAMRGRIWSKISRKIIISSRSGGGDPKENLSLRYIIDEARAVNMPKDTIEKAIAKGTGELGAESFDAVVYEGYGPSGVAFIVEGLTNNRTRTAPEIRRIFEMAGGNLATSGAVAFQFIKQGIIAIKSDAIPEDQLIELALDAGAEDVKNEGEVYEVITTPAAFLKVKENLTNLNIPIEAAEITNVPNTTIPVQGDIAQRILKLIDAFEDHEDVQSVSHNAEIPESVSV